MPLKIVTADITQISCDAIVNSTTSNLQPCGEIDSAIHRTAGPMLAEECKTKKLCSIGTCVITKGYNLPCKYVIHTVAPYVDAEESAHNLACCYKNAIKLAINTGCSSIAFPLIGSGAKGFTTEKAISIALNRIEVDLKSIGTELLVILVLHDEKTTAEAFKKAAQILKPEYLIEESRNSDDGLHPESKQVETAVSENRWISLCCVNWPDRNNDIWMKRLADAIDGTLIAPEFDENSDQIFANRRLIYNQDGPKEHDQIGFWEWSELPKSDGSGKWLSDATYIEGVTPIELITLGDDVSSPSDIVTKLESGVSIPSYVYGNIMFVTPTKGPTFGGVLCNLNQLNVHSGQETQITLKSDVYKLPYFLLSDDDVFTWRQRRIYKYISLKEPTQNVYVHAVNEVIKQNILNKMNWPIFKAQGVSRKDWRKLKDFLEEISTESIYEEISSTYDMALSEAQECVSTFLASIEGYIDVTDIDSALFQQIIENHTGIREQCEKVTAEHWQNEHQKEISAAEAEIAQIHQKASDAVREAEQQLQSLTQEKYAVEDEKSAILVEIASSQQKLDGLLKEIERYEALGNDTVQAVRAKIGEAQKDMAGFIAELSMFMPQIKADVEVPHESRVSNHWRFIEGLSYNEDEDLCEDDIEECSSWEDTLDTLKSNLQLAGVGEQWVGYLSAVLYSAYVNKVHLLLAGPNAKNIADAVSMAITGHGIPSIKCYGEKEESAILAAYAAKDPLIAVENPFHPDWISCMPYINYGVCDTEKTMLWLHPFVEDLAIEPCGLYNYVLPIFTECFVEQKASWRVMTAGIPQDGYETYHSSEKTFVQMRHIKKLGISKLVTNRIQTLLNAAKDMSGISNSDMEYLFALLPFSVLNGKQHTLKEALETEKSISSAVKSEVMRYIEEERNYDRRTDFINRKTTKYFTIL